MPGRDKWLLEEFRKVLVTILGSGEVISVIRLAKPVEKIKGCPEKAATMPHILTIAMT